MAAIASVEDLTTEQKASLNKVQQRFRSANKLHSQFTDRWNTWYGLSRNWRRLQRAHSQATTPPDKDVVLNDLQRQFGQELFIPYCFTVMETNLPRIVSQSPQFRALPGELPPDPKAAEEIFAAQKPLEKLYERDASAMNFETKLQETVRSGLRYGLGVQKEYWDKRTRDGKKIVSRVLGLGRKVVDSEVVVFEGPCCESVDIFDFFWDPSARDLESAAYVIHRVWLSYEQVQQRIAEGRRNREEGLDRGWFDLDLEKLKGIGTSTGRGDVWDGRYRAAGMDDFRSEGDDLFEVWEYHDRNQVLTVMGGAGGILVAEEENPFLHGEFPFQIYRPTLVEQEFVGIGEIEPIAHLQWELNTLRGQRRDAATLALNRGYFYQVGTLDLANMQTGPGVFVPVFGNPSEIIQPMPFTEPPASSVSEEQAIKADIELTTAMSESVVGTGGEETATGTQLVQQAANFRIKQKAKNLHLQLLVPGTKLKKALYEQYVVAEDQTQTVRYEDASQPTGYSFVNVTPEMFGLNIEVVPVDGSTEADDPAQKKHDAGELAVALAPFAEKLNVPALIKYILEQHDVEQPGQWLNKEPSSGEVGAKVAESVFNGIKAAMQRAGLPEEEIAQILEAAHGALEAEQSQPSEEQGQSSAPEEPAAPTENGAAPEPIGA